MKRSGYDCNGPMRQSDGDGGRYRYGFSSCSAVICKNFLHRSTDASYGATGQFIADVHAYCLTVFMPRDR